MDGSATEGSPSLNGGLGAYCIVSWPCRAVFLSSNSATIAMAENRRQETCIPFNKSIQPYHDCPNGRIVSTKTGKSFTQRQHAAPVLWRSPPAEISPMAEEKNGPLETYAMRTGQSCSFASPPGTCGRSSGPPDRQTR